MQVSNTRSVTSVQYSFDGVFRRRRISTASLYMYVCIKYINYIVARFNVRSKQRLLCFTSFVQSQFQTQWSLRCKKSEIQGILLCCSQSYTFTSKNQFYHITTYHNLVIFVIGKIHNNKATSNISLSLYISLSKMPKTYYAIY